VASNVVGVELAEAEAIYDSGREACAEFIVRLAATVAAHEERLRRVENERRRDSTTSSKPASEDPAKSRQQRRAEARAKAKELLEKDRARRKAGAQDGHRGAGRRLVGEGQVAGIVEHYPDRCRGCEREFTDGEKRPRGRYGRHQVCDLPPISVITIEHRTRRLPCPRCKTKTTAQLPAEIADSPFGSRLRAAILTLTARNRVSREGAGELAGELFGANVSTGSIDAICQHASDALAGPYQALRAWILEQDALHVDETGWKTAGDPRALWTLTCPRASFLQIAEHCNREVFNELLGDYQGIVISDRWPGYEHLDPDLRQVCWSHLQRDFRRHSVEGLGEQKTFGEQGLAITKRVFDAWREHRDGHHDRARLLAALAPLQHQLKGLLEHAARNSAKTKHHRRFANNLLKIWPALWTFASHPSVEPTNNPAERALRAPVIHRKLSHGTRTDDGERFAERALSAAATCRQQGRSLFAYLVELITAHTRGDPLPALV
jgi:transposase